MGVVYDKLLKRPLLHSHSSSAWVLTDTNGVQWTVTVDTSGALVTTKQEVATGQPFGPWLWLTYNI